MRTATNHASRWLFLGRGAGQPLRAETFRQRDPRTRRPAAAGRGATIRQLVLQAPAPVVAQAFGYHDKDRQPTRHRSRRDLEPLRQR